MFKLKQRVEELEKGETKDLLIMNSMSDKIRELEKTVEASRENLMLLMDYLGVHLEHINEKVVVDNEDYLGCGGGSGEDGWEDVCPDCVAKK
jgi:uncharacterized coiled-coil protein SlyX